MHKYIHIHTYIHICVYVWLGSTLSFKHILLNNKDTFCLYNFIRILSSFMTSVLVLGRS